MEFLVKQHKQPRENTLTHSVLLFFCSLCSSWFPLYWPSLTPFQPLSLTSMLAESIREHWVRHSHPTGLGYLHRRCHCQELWRIHFLPPSRLHCHLNYGSPHSSQTNRCCPKCFQVNYHHHLLLDGSRFFWFCAHSTIEFVLQGSPLRTKLVAQVIFLTI